VKIAFVADDERSLSSHFGRAPYVVVVSVENGTEVGREVRQKEAHGAGEQHEHGEHEHGVHVHEPGEHSHAGDHGHHHGDHGSKFAAMQDCDVMIVRGIGSPALAHAEGMGLKVFLTRERTIDSALARYLEGTLDHDERRVHQH
jgi:predicted Fe-Mo cluster-binding NifX family protein